MVYPRSHMVVRGMLDLLFTLTSPEQQAQILEGIRGAVPADMRELVLVTVRDDFDERVGVEAVKTLVPLVGEKDVHDALDQAERMSNSTSDRAAARVAVSTK